MPSPSTWQTSVTQLTAPGLRLLRRLAFLAPEPVPDFMLDVPVPGAETENLRNGLADLVSYSLATQSVQRPVFTVHRLVQEVTKRRLDTAQRAEAATEALRWIAAGFVGAPEDVSHWPRLAPLALHAVAVVDGVGGNGPRLRGFGRLGRIGARGCRGVRPPSGRTRTC